MKVKDLERTANVAWSPKTHYPIYIAAGTAAQQLDASFNTNAALELYSLNLTEPGMDLQLKSSLPSEHRFHKVIWGAHGADGTNGTIITGCDGGLIQIYSAAKLIKAEGQSALIGRQEKHTGPVHALDFNPFQQNLFASGASESEIFIWDLNHTATPMSPGAKSQPSEDVLSVAWNRQVQHILASTFASKCVIWDLRKNEPIIKLTDTVSRIRWKVVAWHPEVATQLCLASEEDHSPIIQLWDLRFATSPLKTLENHQRGVLSVAWCADDADLLVSCGKDNRILCWNPNSNQTNGEVLAEIAKTNQWTFDVSWCPRNPALIACPNFDGHVSIYSLMGGKTQQIQTTNKIADSFPGMDGYAQAPVIQHSSTTPESVDLTKPPKWLKRPVGASFGFGGRLVTFEHDKEAIAQATANIQSGQPGYISRTVQISQVITEPELVKKSNELEQALECGNFIEYCLSKADATNDQHKKYIWHFLKANFESNPRAELLNLLGYRIEDVNERLEQFIGKKLGQSVDNITDQFSNLNRLDDLTDDLNEPKPKVAPFKIKTGDDMDGLITQAILLNNVEAAVELCFKAKRFADALIIATAGSPELLAKTQHRYLQQSEGYIASLISAMVSEDWASIMNDCQIDSWKEALAAALTHASDNDLPLLCEQLGSRLEMESKTNDKLAKDAQLCYICSGNFDKLVNSWSGNAMNSTNDLQELIELVTFLQKAVERQGRQVQVSGALANLLSHYASILASQGDLKTALAYLGSSQNEKVAALRERLYVSLGQKPVHVQEMRQQQSRRSSTRQSFTNYNNFAPSNPFSNPAPVANVATQPWQTPSVPTPPISTYNQPPARTFSPAPPPLTQPPRSPSVGSNPPPSSGLHSKKYVLDPSVASNQPMFSRNQFAQQPDNYASFQNNFQNNFANNMQNNYPSNSLQNNFTPTNQNQFNPMASSANIFTPAPIGTLNPTPLVPSNPVPNPSLNPTPMVPAPPLSSNNGVQEAVNYSANAPAGWNDPPIVNKVRPQPKQEAPTTEPIRHPIFGASQPDVANNNGYTDPYAAPPQQQQFPPPYQSQPTQMFQPPPTMQTNNFAQSFNPGNFNQNPIAGVPQQMNNAPQAPVEVRKAPEPVQKPPIPEEHIHMQTVFDELKNQCFNSTNNAQTKRKLDDVGRKLEALYDMLREQRLSPNTLASLHQLVQLIQNGDYTGGLNLHTQLVSGPDFAQIASFMPGLKVLLQLAIQLQVYLR